MTKKNLLFIFIFITFSSLVFGQSKLEKMLDKVYDKIEGDSAKPKKNSFFALPIWGVYPETGWQLGVSLVYLYRNKNDSNTRPSLIRLNAQTTELNQYSIRPYIDLFTKNNKYNIKAIYTFKKYNEYYWGIGNETPNSNKALYDFSQNRLQLRFTKQVVKGLYLGLQSEQNLTNGYDFKGDSLFDKKEIIGKNGSFTSGLGLVVSFDTRNQIYYPTKGHFIDITTLFNHTVFGSEFNFNNITIDARKYFKLWNENVLAIQGFANFNDGNIPFKQLAIIGSESYMRGYYNGRFRDNHAMAFQAELRKKVWGPISLTFFGGFGNVASQTSLLFNNIKPNYGMGFRAIAIRREHVNIRIDYGRGENGIQGFYFTMNEAF
ncbi:MAG: BamA/TamA family outer membrane protein [Bacteroidia bacterium]|nr:BamA/TamA family outer membrane protein [Bacteroidia bacterium]